MPLEIEMAHTDLSHKIATYDASICYVYNVMGKMIDKIKSCRLYNRTIIAIIADHSEALWEHGFFGHNDHLYEELSCIPLIIQPPFPVVIKGIKNENLI